MKRPFPVMSTGQKTEKIKQDVQPLKRRNNFDYFKTSTWKSLVNLWRALSTHVKTGRTEA